MFKASHLIPNFYPFKIQSTLSGANTHSYATLAQATPLSESLHDNLKKISSTVLITCLGKIKIPAKNLDYYAELIEATVTSQKMKCA